MKFIQLLMKKPTDKNIRLIKIIFGLILIIGFGSSFYYFGRELDISFFGLEFYKEYNFIVEYILTGMGIIPVLSGIIDPKVTKAKYVKRGQVLFAIFLFWVGFQFQESANLGFENFIWLLAFPYFFMGATGKLITEKTKKVGEKIIKVRV